MPVGAPSIEVLLIQLWIHEVEPFATALATAGVAANIKRVDIEPAVNAALGRRSYDLVIFDTRTPGLSLEMVQTCMRTHGIRVPLVVVDGRDLLDDVLTSALRQRQS
jgi:DNA-binding response OmpR family regulator